MVWALPPIALGHAASVALVLAVASVAESFVPADVFAWCGGSVLFRPSYLADVGLFDERFFLYYEDTDLSWRGAARGWRYRYVPEAVTRHVHAASTGEGSPVFQYYVERHFAKGAARALPPSPLAWVRLAVRNLRVAAAGEGTVELAPLAAVLVMDREHVER